MGWFVIADVEATSGGDDVGSELNALKSTYPAKFNAVIDQRFHNTCKALG